MTQHPGGAARRPLLITRKSFLILSIAVGLLCLLGDDPVRLADRRLPELVPETEAE